MTTSFQQDAIESLLASLTGPTNRLMEMPVAITKDHLPKDLPFHQKYLDVLWEINIHGGAPTREAVIHGLGIKYPKEKEIAERVDSILAKRSESEHIRSLSAFIADWLNEELADSGLDEAKKIMRSMEGTASERWQKAKQMIDQRLINTHRQTRMTSVEAMDVYLAILDRAHERAKAGLPPGPVFPWDSVRKFIPVLSTTEMMLFTGLTGRGKTSVITVFAEHNAHVEDVPFLFIALETDVKRFMQREVARKLLIPTQYQESGNINRHEEPWRSLFEQMRSDIIEAEQAKAPLIWDFAAGASNTDIEQSIYLFSELCRSQNKPGAVAIDYLQKMQRVPGLDQRETLVFNSEQAKVWAERYDVHITLLSQEAEGSDGQARAKGSSEPQDKAQVHISLEREKATDNLPIPGKNSQQPTDYMGNPRFWHKADEWAAKSILNIVKHNNGPLGRPTVWIENGFFRIITGKA